jgi:heat shock protein HslJ
MRTRLLGTGLIALVAMAGAALLGACGGDDIAGSAPTASSEPTAESSVLDGTWTLQPDGFDVPLSKDTAPTLTIAGTSWTGFGGCNRYMTTATLTGQNVALSPVAATMMACADPAMAVEDLYLQRLDQVASYSMSGSTLELKDSSGKVLLTFTKG